MRQYIKEMRGADGSVVHAYTIDNEHGLEITAIDFGATITSVRHAINGQTDELLVGFRDISQYQQPGSYVGSTIGRVCNRVKNAIIEIGGKSYQTTRNFGKHTLHGGARGFSYRPWIGRIVAIDSRPYLNVEGLTIRFTLLSAHLDEGFPGELQVTADYTVTVDNRLIIEYHAEADRDTAVNLTNHAYWNLAGGGSVASHRFFINADKYMQTDKMGVFDGIMIPVAERSEYDFRTPRFAIDGTGAPVHYDVCYHLNNSVAEVAISSLDSDLYSAAFVTSEPDGRSMLISTTYPSLQFFLPEKFTFPPVPDAFVPNGAFCMECMLHNDATRFPELPTTILPKGHRYYHRTVHQFGGVSTAPSE